MLLKKTRKRNNKNLLKEKRREDKFVSRYIQIKYPDIHNEAISSYKSLVDKYPGRADITKTYFFKKWESKNQRKEPQMYVPYLPILKELPGTTRAEIVEEGQQQEEIDEEGQQQEEIVEEGQQQEEIDEEGQQQEEIVEEGQQQESPQTPPQQDFCSTMTIDQMSIAVEEIVKTLQSDREVMDIVESFDLPPRCMGRRTIDS